MAENTSSSFVIDSSFMLAYLFPDEKKQFVDEIFTEHASGEIDLYAPTLLFIEVLNGIRSALLRNRITTKQAYKLSQAFLDLSIICEDINYLDVFNLSLDNTITTYDASYLYLSRKKNLPLLSLDRNLQKLGRMH